MAKTDWKFRIASVSGNENGKSLSNLQESDSKIMENTSTSGNPMFIADGANGDGIALQDRSTEQLLPVEAAEPPIQDRINAAYVRALSSAIDAVNSVVEAGNLLIKAKETVIVEGGQWLKWLAINCPNISEWTARRLMTSAAYVAEHNCIGKTSVWDLYIAAGAVKPSEKGPDGDEPQPHDSIITPLIKMVDRFRLQYTDDKIAGFKPIAVPHLLGWIRKTKDELSAFEERVIKRFPEKAAK